MTGGRGELRTARLILRPMSRRLARDITGDRRRPEWAPGFPQDGDRTIARVWLAVDVAARTDAQPVGPWGPYAVWTVSGVCVGTAGFHGPPQGGEVEIGYGIAPGWRGLGLATEAVGALVDLARRHGVGRVVARVDAENASSQRLLDRLGFQVVDSSGAEVCRALSLSGSGAAASA